MLFMHDLVKSPCQSPFYWWGNWDSAARKSLICPWSPSRIGSKTQVTIHGTSIHPVAQIKNSVVALDSFFFLCLPMSNPLVSVGSNFQNTQFSLSSYCSPSGSHSYLSSGPLWRAPHWPPFFYSCLLASIPSILYTAVDEIFSKCPLMQLFLRSYKRIKPWKE